MNLFACGSFLKSFSFFTMFSLNRSKSIFFYFIPGRGIFSLLKIILDFICLFLVRLKKIYYFSMLSSAIQSFHFPQLRKWKIKSLTEKLCVCVVYVTFEW